MALMALTENPYYQGPESDHFDGLRFFNPNGVAPLGFRDLLRWNFSETRARWPKQRPLAALARPANKIPGGDLRVTMIGHASMLIQTAGLNILTDPVWSRRASPLAFAGPQRVIAPGIDFDALPRIDVVLVTHNHYDHLDLATLKRLAEAFDPLFLTPLGNDTIMRPAVGNSRVAVLDWGETYRFEGLAFTAEPCHHWSARGLRDRSMALWAAFAIETPAGAIYHIGDTGFHGGRNYRAAAEKYGEFRLAILPIGAYEPRWFMEGQHQNPAEAVEGFRLLGASHAIGHHFGTFQLTNESIEAPVNHLAEALQAAEIEASRFRPLGAGEFFDVPPP